MTTGTESASKTRKSRFPVWRTIKVGTGLKTGSDFRNALAAHKIEVDDIADAMLDQLGFEVTTSEQNVGLVLVTMDDLGLKTATYSQICAEAKKFGLVQCPTDTGPQLRLQYIGRHVNSPNLVVASKTILVSFANDLCVFTVNCDDQGGLHLGGSSVLPRVTFENWMKHSFIFAHQG